MQIMTRTMTTSENYNEKILKLSETKMKNGVGVINHKCCNSELCRYSQYTLKRNSDYCCSQLLIITLMLL